MKKPEKAPKAVMKVKIKGPVAAVKGALSKVK